MTQNKKRRNRKGFTLIELIVVIAILAILAAIAIPAFSNQLNRAKYSTHVANLATLKSAAQICLAENGAPAATITWADNTTAADPVAYSPSNYVDTWPVDPWKGGGVYKVDIVEATGEVNVTFSGTVIS
jgi:type IV pilus assembly protein PilA